MPCTMSPVRPSSLWSTTITSKSGCPFASTLDSDWPIKSGRFRVQIMTEICISACPYSEGLWGHDAVQHADHPHHGSEEDRHPARHEAEIHVAENERGDDA